MENKSVIMIQDNCYNIQNKQDVFRAIFQFLALNFFISIFYITPIIISIFGLNALTIYITAFTFCIHFSFLISSSLLLSFEISDFNEKKYKQLSLKRYLQ